jgi:ribosomal protein S18 acetylase RimI-like enzyme
MIATDASSITIRETGPSDPDAKRCLRLYFAELDRRADTGVDPQVGVCLEEASLVPPLGGFVVAYMGQAAVGCGAIRHHPGMPSEIRRIWVARAARGAGVGRLLLAELELRALASGARAIRLEINRSLHEAIAMFRGAEYAEVAPFHDDPFGDYWFEKQL